MEVGFNTSLLNAELGFNAALVAQETGIELALFGNLGNPVLNTFYNFWNLLLGSGESTLDSLIGLQLPAGLLTGSLAIGTSPIIAGGGLLAAVPTKFLWDLAVVQAAVSPLMAGGSLQAALTAALTGTGLQASLGTTLGGSLFAGLPATGAALVAAPIAGLQGIGTTELGLFTNLVGAETAFNTNLLTNELSLETSLFGTPVALNGAINRFFNAGNVALATGEQTVNSLLGGTQGPALFLTGSGSQVFNGGNIGGIEGVSDQLLAGGADLVGLL
jgi:hypothetical protein